MSAQSKDQTYQPTLFSDFPDEWDELPDKEKERRLDDMDKIALEKDI